MNREQASSIVSLSRLPDWEQMMGYVAGAVRELEMNGMFIDPNDAIGLARLQGARNALANMLNLEDAAHDHLKGETTND